MTWDPNCQVTIGGVSYTSDVLDGVNLSYGRQTVWEQPRASFANVRVLTLDETHFDGEINDVLVITADDSSGNPITLFTGNITNIKSTRAAQGSVAGVTIHTVTAVGPFAAMSRAIIGGSSFPKEDDSDRMTRILTDSGVTIDVVDTPAIYELHTRPGESTTGYQLASTTANQIFGYIYETTDGKVGYANQSRRLNDVQDNGYFNIDESYILASNISTERSYTNILNDLILKYKDNASVTSSNATSQSLYGLASGIITTPIEDAVDAQNLADFYIATRSLPQTSLSEFTIELGSSFLANADRNELLAVNIGKPISIFVLPNSILNYAYTGFVEGWRFVINKKSCQLSLITSDATLSLVPTRWQDVSAATQWEDVDPVVKWYEYE